MKTGPHIVVVVTAAFALGAGVVLAAEDPALFDPQQTLLEALVGDADVVDMNFNNDNGRATYVVPQESARH